MRADGLAEACHNLGHHGGHDLLGQGGHDLLHHLGHDLFQHRLHRLLDGRADGLLHLGHLGVEQLGDAAGVHHLVQRSGQHRLGLRRFQVGQEVIADRRRVGQAVGRGIGLVALEQRLRQPFDLLGRDFNGFDRGEHRGGAFGNELFGLFGFEVFGQVDVKLGRVGVAHGGGPFLITGHDRDDELFDLPGRKGDAAVLHDALQLLRQQGFGFVRFQVADEILAQAREIRLGVVAVVRRVTLEHLLGKFGQLFGRGRELDLAEQRAPVKAREIEPGQVQPGQIEPRKVEARKIHAGQIQPGQIEPGKHGRIEREAAEIKQAVRVDGQCVGIQRKGGFEEVGVDGEQVLKVEAVLLALLAEAVAGKDIDARIGQLVAHDGAGGRLLHAVRGEGGRVVDARAEHGGVRPFGGLHDAHDGQILAVLHELFHISGVVGLVPPDAVGAVVLIKTGSVHELECDAERVGVRNAGDIVRHGDGFFLGKLFDHAVQFFAVAQAEGIEQEIADAAAGGQHKHALVIVFRPAARLDVVLVAVKRFVGGHLIKHVGAGHHRHHAARAGRRTHAQRRKGIVRVDLAVAAVLPEVDLRRNAVGVFDRVGVFFNAAFAAVQVGFERGEVVGADLGEGLGDHLNDADLMLFPVVLVPHHTRHHPGQVHAGALDRERILRKGILLDRLDVLVDAGGQRQDQRNADDADAPGKGGQQRAGFFGAQVLEAERKGRCKRHAGPARPAAFDRFFLRFGRGERVGVGADDAVA